jgi:hypothetical protein
MTKELKAAVTITKPNHTPAPVNTKFLDFSHSPGDTNTTGTPITSAKERRINTLTSNWRIPTIFFLLKDKIQF